MYSTFLKSHTALLLFTTMIFENIIKFAHCVYCFQENQDTFPYLCGCMMSSFIWCHHSSVNWRHFRNFAVVWCHHSSVNWRHFRIFAVVWCHHSSVNWRHFRIFAVVWCHHSSVNWRRRTAKCNSTVCVIWWIAISSYPHPKNTINYNSVLLRMEWNYI